MKKILSVVGARPQFIKAAALSPEIRKNYKEVLVHTGQHYDYAMSQEIFDTLKIPKPDYNLSVGSGSHSGQTAKIMIGLEKIINKEKPDAVLVYGDTNSTIATALVAAKNNIPLIHIEAGARSFDRTMPEEINRVTTDHLSTLLFCTTSAARNNLKKEGINKNVFVVGNVMEDILWKTLPTAREQKNKILKKYDVDDGKYSFVTIHRASNTDNKKILNNIFNSLSKLDRSAIVALHPRTKAALTKHRLLSKIKKDKNVTLLSPINYLESVVMQMSSSSIITDSGGMQREAFFLNKPVYTLRTSTEWPETVVSGWNVLVDPSSHSLTKKLSKRHRGRGNNTKNPKASQKIVRMIEKIVLHRVPSESNNNP